MNSDFTSCSFPDEDVEEEEDGENSDGANDDKVSISVLPELDSNGMANNDDEDDNELVVDETEVEL